MRDQLHERHFAELTRLIEDHTGIRLPSVKRTMVEGRLRKRVRALGLKDLSEYGAAIFNHGRLSEEFAHVVDCVTTNKTDFFREPQHFAFLRDSAIPNLLKLRRPPGAPLKFWSAAASIGAEAYTIAFVAADLLGLDGPPFAILGTDISREVLEQARRAVYPLALAEPIPDAVRRRYLMFARDASRAEFRIAPELRRRVRFEALNLMDDQFAVDSDFDVIFCRNVLIYFSKPTQSAVLRRLSAHLRPGGYLLLGHSESLAGNDHAELRPVAPTVFRRAF
jgi:chemotaxis protein methyltransferase CheR